MSASTNLISRIQAGGYDTAFSRLYGADNVEAQRARYIGAVEGFVATFGDDDVPLKLFSAPGRTEICGNHTDHNHGCVVAGSVNLDVIAVVRPTVGPMCIQSAGYPMDTVSLDNLLPVEDEINTSAALIRGTAARFASLGYAVGGFEAYTTSNVLKGSGLSSSAAFEVLVGVILNNLYNANRVSAVEIAQIAQYAENIFFGKPSGLMDQMASSVGNIITIDFADTDKPIIEKLDFDFESTGYALCIVDVGGDHADLTHEYAAVPGEMKAVANTLGVEYLRETDLDAVLANIADLRKAHGDRAVLRALHFLRENDRVAAMVTALKAGDFDTFKAIILASGDSSYKYLQNVYASCDLKEQSMSLALFMAEMLLKDCGGAWRVHGGGFGGTTQNFVPLAHLDAFRTAMEKVFGVGSCHVLNIRPYGGVSVDAVAAQ